MSIVVRKKCSISVLGLLAVLVLTIIPANAIEAPSFKDCTAKDSCYAAAVYVSQHDIYNGVDGNFVPAQELTYMDISVMLVNAHSGKQEGVNATLFYLLKAKQSGYLNDVEGPFAKATVSDAVQTIFKAQKNEKFFKDTDGKDTALTIAKKAGIIKTEDDGQAVCTREIAAKAIMLAAVNSTVKESNHG